jgi:hypothetical protein
MFPILQRRKTILMSERIPTKKKPFKRQSSLFSPYCLSNVTVGKGYEFIA